eukprot:11184102-Lingulodinium_polyedra.AAC.1
MHECARVRARAHARAANDCWAGQKVAGAGAGRNSLPATDSGPAGRAGRRARGPMAARIA